jgi:hypothetical protein
MIFVNILLSLLFIAFNFMYSSIATGDHLAQWSPLWLTFYNIRAIIDLGGDLGAQYPNFAFYFFWVSTIVNIYFLFKLQRSKETKPTT